MQRSRPSFASRAALSALAAVTLASTPGASPTASAWSGLPCAYDVTLINGPSYPPDFPSTNVDLYDMNDAGVAVGSIRLLDPLPCIWSKEGGLQYLPTPPELTEGTAVGINDNGWVLVNAEIAAEGPRVFVGIPANDKWAWIKLGPVSGFGWIWAIDINNRNEVVGKQSVGGPDEIYPLAGFRWALGEPVTTIQIPGWNATECHGINDDGVICGSVSQRNQAASSVASTRAFVMTDDGTVIIEPVPPYTRSTGDAVNNAGVVGVSMMTGSSVSSIGLGCTFDSTDGALTLIPVPAGYIRWSISALNDCGTLVGSARKAGAASSWRACVAFNGVATMMSDLIDPTYQTGQGGALAVTSNGTVVGACIGDCARIYHPIESVAADLDCDGVVGATDLQAILAAWNSPSQAADLDGNGWVDATDLGLLLSAWGTP